MGDDGLGLGPSASPLHMWLLHVPGVEDLDLPVDLGVGDVTVCAVTTTDHVPHHRDGPEGEKWP